VQGQRPVGSQPRPDGGQQPRPGQRPPQGPPRQGVPRGGNRPPGSQGRPSQSGRRPPVRPGTKKKIDIWLIAAIIAAVIAIMLISYGIYHTNSGADIDLSEFLNQPVVDNP